MKFLGGLMGVWIFTFISLLYSTNSTEFSENVIQNRYPRKTEVFITTSSKFRLFCENLLGLEENNNNVEDKCPICLDKLGKSNSNETVAIILHKNEKSIPHCFHYDCLNNWRQTATSICPVCRGEFEISEEMQERISLDKLFNEDPKNLTERDRKNILSAISKMYEKDRYGMISLFLDRMFSENTLIDIIISDSSHENWDLKQSLRTVMEIKKGPREIGTYEFMRCWIMLLRLANYDFKIVDLMVNMIVKNGISSQIRTLDLSHRCITVDNLRSFTALFRTLESLESLNISFNQMGVDEMKVSAEILKECNNLIFLDISWNAIDDNMIKELANILRGYVNLEILNVSSNKIGDYGMIVLANAFRGHENLRSLNVSYNEFGNIGRNALDELEKSAKELRVIHSGIL